MTRAQDVPASFVETQRARRASWGAIALMAGCSEVDLRRHHDPKFGAAALAAVPRRTPAPRDAARGVLVRAGLHPDDALMVARLWQANGARVSNEDLARGLAVAPDVRSACLGARRRAEALGIAFGPARHGLALTAEGVSFVSELMRGTG